MKIARLKTQWQDPAVVAIQCRRCGRYEYALPNAIDRMTAPDGGECGGVFTASPFEVSQISAAWAAKHGAKKREKVS